MTVKSELREQDPVFVANRLREQEKEQKRMDKQEQRSAEKQKILEEPNFLKRISLAQEKRPDLLQAILTGSKNDFACLSTYLDDMMKKLPVETNKGNHDQIKELFDQINIIFQCIEINTTIPKILLNKAHIIAGRTGVLHGSVLKTKKQQDQRMNSEGIIHAGYSHLFEVADQKLLQPIDHILLAEFFQRNKENTYCEYQMLKHYYEAAINGNVNDKYVIQARELLKALVLPDEPISLAVTESAESEQIEGIPDGDLTDEQKTSIRLDVKAALNKKLDGLKKSSIQARENISQYIVDKEKYKQAIIQWKQYQQEKKIADVNIADTIKILEPHLQEAKLKFEKLQVFKKIFEQLKAIEDNLDQQEIGKHSTVVDLTDLRSLRIQNLFSKDNKNINKAVLQGAVVANFSQRLESIIEKLTGLNAKPMEQYLARINSLYKEINLLYKDVRFVLDNQKLFSKTNIFGGVKSSNFFSSLSGFSKGVKFLVDSINDLHSKNYFIKASQLINDLDFQTLRFVRDKTFEPLGIKLLDNKNPIENINPKPFLASPLNSVPDELLAKMLAHQGDVVIDEIKPSAPLATEAEKIQHEQEYTEIAIRQSLPLPSAPPAPVEYVPVIIPPSAPTAMLVESSTEVHEENSIPETVYPLLSEQLEIKRHSDRTIAPPTALERLRKQEELESKQQTKDEVEPGAPTPAKLSAKDLQSVNVPRSQSQLFLPMTPTKKVKPKEKSVVKHVVFLG